MLELTRRLLVGLAAAIAVATTTPLDAHPVLLEASPLPNATVAPPAHILLRFNNRVERRLSRVRLRDARGAQLDLELASDAAPDRLSAHLPRLAPGAWHVEWQVLSADGHIVSGRYSFQIAP